MAPQLGLEGLVGETDVPVFGHFWIAPNIATSAGAWTLQHNTLDTKY